MEIFNTWRTDLQAELQLVSNELTAAEQGLADAQAAAEEARQHRDEVNAAFDRLHPKVELSAELSFRREQIAATARSAEGKLTGARLTVRGIQRRVSDLEHALAQLDVIAGAPPKAEPDALAELVTFV
jgi:chromosome segregation ATPase